MESSQKVDTTPRYRSVAQEKAAGATYTPKILADFVAKQIADSFEDFPSDAPLRILDPAVGHGELLISLLGALAGSPEQAIEVYGFDTSHDAILAAQERIRQQFPDVSLHFKVGNFLEFAVEQFLPGECDDLWRNEAVAAFDLVIANPPYVRTQVMGAKQAQLLAKKFGLSGRIDLYYAFVLGILRVIRPKGVAGIIVSNRFMTTKSGASMREALLRLSNLLHAWDLGDTKLFDAAVLPAVLLVEGKRNTRSRSNQAAFTSIYQTTDPATRKAANPIASLDTEGVAKVNDGRHFQIKKGKLRTNGMAADVWRLAVAEDDDWLASVDKNRWGTFGDIGKIHVGVKTCADRVFV